MRLPESCHSVHERVLECERDYPYHENAYAPYAVFYHDLVVGKQRRERPRRYERNAEHYRGKGYAHRQYALFTFLYQLRIPRAVIETYHRLTACTYSEHRHGYHRHERLHHGQSAYPCVGSRTAVHLQRHVAEYDDYAVRRDDEERRYAETNYPQHYLQVVAAQRKSALRAFKRQEHYYENKGYQLLNDGRESRSDDVHVEHENKQRVERDIEQRARKRRRHTYARISLRNDELIEPDCQHAEKSARRIYREIAFSVSESRFARAERGQQRIHRREYQHDRQRRKAQQHNECVGQYLFCLVLVPLSHRHRKERRAAETYERSERSQQRCHWRTDTERGQRDVARSLDIADVHSVHDGIQHAYELRQHRGQSEF